MNTTQPAARAAQNVLDAIETAMTFLHQRKAVRRTGHVDHEFWALLKALTFSRSYAQDRLEEATATPDPDHVSAALRDLKVADRAAECGIADDCDRLHALKFVRDCLNGAKKNLEAAQPPAAQAPVVDMRFSPSVVINSDQLLAAMKNDPGFSRHVVNVAADNKRAVKDEWGFDVKGA